MLGRLTLSLCTVFDIHYFHILRFIQDLFCSIFVLQHKFCISHKILLAREVGSAIENLVVISGFYPYTWWVQFAPSEKYGEFILIL